MAMALATMLSFGILALLISAVACDQQKPKVSAVFAIGDSGLDAGTNNYIPTSQITANFPPYGQSYFKHPTGRWTNGRVLPDFLAQALGLRFPVPYLSPAAHFDHGVNFASGGAGFLDSTNADNGVVSLNTQLCQFRDLVRSYQDSMGESAASAFLANSIVLFNMGANDIAPSSDSTSSFNPDEYTLMLNAFFKAIRQLYYHGIRKFVVFGVPAIGCSPHARNAVSQAIGVKAAASLQCIDPINQAAKAFNDKLESATNTLAQQLHSTSLLFVDSFALGMDAVRDPQKYGFSDVKNACCGGGAFNGADGFNGAIGCNSTANLCSDPNSHMFWDQNHPTEAMYAAIFRAVWYGTKQAVRPYGLATLFHNNTVPNPPASSSPNH